MSAIPDYPYSHNLLRREDMLAVMDCRGSHLCGYCGFRDEEIPAHWRGNYAAPGLQFLSVHGGLTYANSVDGWSVFGFDCAHAGDDARPELRDPDYVLRLAKQMSDQIAALAARYEEWHGADREGKAAIIDSIREQAELPTEFGFGGLIEMMAGAPSLGEPNPARSTFNDADNQREEGK